MKKIRKVVFWLHLAAGLVAGAVLLVMLGTGVLLAFNGEIVAWSERAVRRVAVPAEATALPLDELLRSFREQRPEVQPTAVTVPDAPTAAVTVGAGREKTYYVDPYTGRVSEPAEGGRVRSTLRLCLQLHRWLAFGGEARSVGRAINDTANLVFLFLLLSGFWLWWPRRWTRRGLRAVTTLNGGYTGRARDRNWHTVAGFWCALVLLVVSVTAIPIAYRWTGGLIYRLLGETPPVLAAGRSPFAPATLEIPRPEGRPRPLGYTALLAAARVAVPGAEAYTFQLGGGRGGHDGPAAGRKEGRGRAEGGGDRNQSRGGGGRPATIRAVSVTAKVPGAWPRTAGTTVHLHPFTGEVLGTDSFAGYTPATKVRHWMRFLHTGQALGWWGQALVALACAGGCVLVCTGFALSWRRFFRRPGNPGVRPPT